MIKIIRDICLVLGLLLMSLIASNYMGTWVLFFSGYLASILVKESENNDQKEE